MSRPRSLNDMLSSFADFPRYVRTSAVLSALLAVLVAYSGPLLITFQAAEAGKLTQSQLSTWIWSATIATGISAIILSAWYRQPVACAFGSAGAVLMVTALKQYSLAEAVGAYIVAGIGVTLLGFSGLFSRMLALIPRGVISALIAGVIFRFGIGLFTEFPNEPLLIGIMTLTFFVSKRLGSRTPSIFALIVGAALALALGKIAPVNLQLQLTQPELTLPVFSWQAVVSLSLPLFLLTNTQQNAPGIAVLRNDGYDTPADGPLIVTGIISTLTAPFNNHGVNLAAITAALVTGPDAHPDKDKRYVAGIFYGIWYIVFGLFGATIVTLFTALPKALVSGMAGLALLGAIVNGLSGAMSEPREREGALMTFMLTVSNIELLGIGAPFWGLVVGVLVNGLLNARRSAKNT